MSSLVDTHSHLNFNAFETDLAEVLERAEQAGVVRCVVPAIDMVTSREVIELTTAHPPLFAAVGLHPNEALAWQTDTLDLLRNFTADKKVVAIGEIGLDYYWERSPHDHQKQIFQHQLDLAGELEMPVIIHNREATGDVLEILAQWTAELNKRGSPLAQRPGVLHSFSADLPAARQAVEMGFYIGITGPVTFKKSEQLREIVVKLPLERLLVETDAPFLTPHPYRGKRNEPAYVQHVAAKIAQIRNMPETELAARTTENAFRLFNW